MQTEHHDDHRRPLGKELAIVIIIGVFIIYLVAGGLALQHGYFDGTIMYKLFPAMAWGYVGGCFVGTGIAHYYPQGIPVWIISGAVTFGLVTWLEMIDFRWGRLGRSGRGFGAFLVLIIVAVRLLLHLIQWIRNRSSK